MNKILGCILILLMILVGGKRGVKASITLVLNFLVLLVAFYLITLGISPIVVSLLGCCFIAYIVLFLTGGDTIKTRTTFLSVLLVLLLMTAFIIVVTKGSMIEGFGSESYEEINMFSYDIGIRLTDITVSLILIGLIGAMIDTSIAIASAVYEVYTNNKDLNQKQLFHSGMRIGRDILGTTVNTLFFAFLGEFITLLIWFYSCHYSFGEIINAKVFCAEFVKILFIGFGSIFIIPISAYMISYQITKKVKKE
ncbi:MAG: YibE/F family protein [Bacilli bacterium]|nr:YibE/F family protein [Bacilli bacterium]